jgi:hypothetical protein
MIRDAVYVAEMPGSRVKNKTHIPRAPVSGHGRSSSRVTTWQVIEGQERSPRSWFRSFSWSSFCFEPFEE